MSLKSVLSFASFSELSENALERAAKIAAQRAIPLHVLRHPGDDVSRVPDYHQRLVLRVAQLAQRHGADVRIAAKNEAGLARWLQTGAQELLVVLDPKTARLPLQSGSLLKQRSCPLWIVKQPATHQQRELLLPYREAQEADRLLRFAGQIAAGPEREMFVFEPPCVAAAKSNSARVEGPRREWPPPPDDAAGGYRLRHSDYLSTRLNRAVRGFGPAGAALRIGNQARYSAADLIITPYRSASLLEVLLQRSLRDRLVDGLLGGLNCDLVFLPEPEGERSALTAVGRLRQALLPGPLVPASAKEHRHG